MLKHFKTSIALTIAAVTFAIVTVLAQTPSLRSLDGNIVNLNSQRGKVVVLSFGTKENPLAAKELPALQKLADRYSSNTDDASSIKRERV